MSLAMAGSISATALFEQHFVALMLPLVLSQATRLADSYSNLFLCHGLRRKFMNPGTDEAAER